jgi:CubicO group peptidase (beta-lactamase class C family)
MVHSHWKRRIISRTCIAALSLAAQSGNTSFRNVAAQHKDAVEHNLRYLVRIVGHPDSGMSLTERMAHYHVPGVSIAVIHHGRVEWTAGYGVKRLDGPPVTPDTLFNAASMTKPITAVAVLQLVQEGKINLDAPVNSYLKGWKLPENQYTIHRQVTVRELLNHTSGIGTHNGEVIDPDKGIPTLLQMLNGQKPSTISPVRVEAIPGSKFAYSNGGYLVLQLLIHTVTGMSYAQYVQQTVLRPLHMNHSAFDDPLTAQQAASAATGYWENGISAIAPAHFMEPNLAAGGLWTTARDYAKFMIELQREYAGTSHLILDRTMARMMIIPGMGPSESMRWGLGVHVGGTPPNLFFEHGGSGVFQTESIGYLDGDGVVILTNGGDGGKLVDEIARSVSYVYHWPDFRQIEHTVVQVNPAIYDGLAGTYGFIKVMREGDRLTAEIPIGSRPVEIFPESNVRYFLRDFPTTLVFDLGPTGKATGVEFITTVVRRHQSRTQ